MAKAKIKTAKAVNPVKRKTPKETDKPTQAEAEAAVRTLIRWAGDDPDREGLLDTPARVARSYGELFEGYETDPREYLERVFEEVGGYDELVVLSNIRVVSFCEHHMLPVTGVAHVGYLPSKRVVGISKLARVVQGFARRSANSGKAHRRRRQSHRRSPEAARRRRRHSGRAFLHDHSRRQQSGFGPLDQPSDRRGPQRSEDAAGIPAADERRASSLVSDFICSSWPGLTRPSTSFLL